MEKEDKIKGAKGYANLTLKKLTDILEELQVSEIKSKSKSYVAWGSCKSRGFIKFDMSEAWWCNDTECSLCSPFVSSLRKMVSDVTNAVIKQGNNGQEKKKIKPFRKRGSKFHG